MDLRTIAYHKRMKLYSRKHFAIFELGICEINFLKHVSPYHIV